MSRIKKLYAIISWTLLLVQAGFLVIYTCSAFRGRIVFYEAKEMNYAATLRLYFTGMNILFITSIAMFVLWCLLTPYAILLNRRIGKIMINPWPGLLGFIFTIIHIASDPFHLLAWYTGETQNSLLSSLW